MKRVAVFGNAGGGKSTLARQLAAITGLPLRVIDQLQFKEGGAAVPKDEYLKLHRDLLAQENWIIDGYGDTTTLLERCSAADTFDPHRFVSSNSLLVGDKASDQRTAC
jgi:adenylate kinase family enzyme